MSNDYSRLIFNRKKHYSAVRMQQGRVLLDSDWNSQSDIVQNRCKLEAVDVIGDTGVPVGSDGFRLTQTPEGFSISPGRIYIHGLLCELDETVALSPGTEEMLISTNENTLPYAAISPISESGTYIAYLEAWEREVSYLDDPFIREKALGGPDTTTRLQTVWQLKFAAINENNQCEEIDLTQFEPIPDGQMEAQTVASDANTNHCDFNQTNGYRRLENQLYRIEIQHGGDLANATFKWSRENASVISNVIEKTGNDKVKVHSLGRDEVLGFAIGNWVEFVNHKSSLSRTINQLFQISEINSSTNEITVNGNIDELDEQGLKMVRWDQQEENINLSSDFIPIADDGIEVRFTEGTYRAGDYWQIPARTIDSSIEFEPGLQLPKGVKTYYAKIGIVEIGNGSILSIIDCRKLFPPLTDLPTFGGACSTYNVRPVQGWERIFDRIDPNDDAKICFGIGNYYLSETKVIEGKGHLVLEGAGVGTQIYGEQLQVALRFKSCKSIHLSDLSINTTGVGNSNPRDRISLKGSITFDEVKEVSMERVMVKCGHGSSPTSSAINVYSTKSNPSVVRIENSKFHIGYMQIGIIIINTLRTIIENNQINVSQRPGRPKLLNRLRDNRFRHLIVNRIITDVSDKRSDLTNYTLSHGRHNISFRTDPELKSNRVWERLINDDPPTGISNKRDLKDYAIKKIASLLLDKKALEASPLFNYINAISRQDLYLSYQGIVVGGETGGTIHIRSNDIDGMVQGIHLGLSHQASRIIFDEFSMVKIEKNKITNILGPVTSMGRHGIFVGNCRNLVIDDNDLYLKRSPMATNIEIDAIRLWGKYGEKLQVSNNYVGGFTNNNKLSYTNGIRIVPITSIARNTKWKIVWNTIFSNRNNLIIPNEIFDKYLDTNN